MDEQRSEAQQLWDALELRPGDQVVEAILVGKLVNFETGRTEISIAATDGVDWIAQLGILDAARLLCTQAPIYPADGDEHG